LSDFKSSEGKFTIVICLFCGATFEATPPDKVHDYAASAPEAFKDGIRVELECPKCKGINVLYWG
jgi:rubredoxin